VTHPKTLLRAATPIPANSQALTGLCWRWTRRFGKGTPVPHLFNRLFACADSYPAILQSVILLSTYRERWVGFESFCRSLSYLVSVKRSVRTAISILRTVRDGHSDSAGAHLVVYSC
jgi:hypothetical protein